MSDLHKFPCKKKSKNSKYWKPWIHVCFDLGRITSTDVRFTGHRQIKKTHTYCWLLPCLILHLIYQFSGLLIYRLRTDFYSSLRWFKFAKTNWIFSLSFSPHFGQRLILQLDNKVIPGCERRPWKSADLCDPIHHFFLQLKHPAVAGNYWWNYNFPFGCGTVSGDVLTWHVAPSLLSCISADQTGLPTSLMSRKIFK